MDEVGKSWRGLSMPSPGDGKRLLCPGEGSGHFGVPRGAPLFLSSGRARREGRAPASGSGAAEQVAASREQPMFIIDRDRKLQMRNAAGQAMLDSRRLVFEQHGKLACRESESDRRLAMALGTLGTASGGGSGGIQRRAVWLRGAEGHGAAATLHLLQGEGTGERRSASVVVTLREPGVAPDIDPRVVATAFNLTNAEARLAAMIASGQDTECCSSELDVKTSTLRSHLSSIYRKTGARGKADLVRLVLALCGI